MRREIFRMERAAATALLERAPVVHLATTLPDGAPILRTVHGVIVDGRLCFHGAPAGEKTEALGRPVVASAEELIAEVPSYFVDPERACPATTYYLSAQVHGHLEEITDLDVKARVLQALMTRFQPEGGHVPITAGDPMYRSAVKGILIVSISLEQLDGKAKLGQNRKPEELALILERLWQRGRVTDARAIDLVRAANPEIPTPPFLLAPEGTALFCAHGTPADADEVAALLEGEYWNVGISRERIARSQLGASAWVTARDANGRIVASARAITDGVKCGWIYDVIVAPALRKRGLGRAIMRLLLDHPSVRDVRTVRLGTRDAQSLYRGFDFTEYTPPFSEMILRRG